MATRTVIIQNKLGLHARAAAKLVSTASAYASSVELRCNEQTADAKSIMAVMMLAASSGTEVTIKTEGNDAESALDALTQLIDERFGEEE